ncbi:MAG TPA: aromatic amino acid lyase, partial [Geminicoccaceae bacterium]
MSASGSGVPPPPDALLLRPGDLTPDDLRRLAEAPISLSLTRSSWEAVDAARLVVDSAAAGERPVYGVNTGFGKLATTRIARPQIEELQRRLIVSHMCGCGAPLSDPVVRLTLALKAASLARGFSGVRRETIGHLLRLHEAGALPVIPSQGS